MPRLSVGSPGLLCCIAYDEQTAVGNAPLTFTACSFSKGDLECTFFHTRQGAPQGMCVHLLLPVATKWNGDHLEINLVKRIRTVCPQEMQLNTLLGSERV